jgi:hypothetical protein
VVRYAMVLPFALALLLHGVERASGATKLLEFDAAIAGAGNEPPDFDPNWGLSGIPMVNTGEFLLQDNTANSEAEYGEYLSPFLPEGTFTHAGAAYGIEFKVRPRTDVPFIGSAWPELFLSWSDNVYNYNVTIDKYHEENTSGNGDIVYGRTSFSPAITDIDWSVPHTIFIGHRGDGESSVFDFYLDGQPISTRIDGSIGRSLTGGFDVYQDSVGFGDGTTAIASDFAAEWYFVRVWDVNNPAATLPGVVGDYSGNGTIGAEDYTIWRDNLGSSAVLPNDPIGGQIGDAQYQQWKTAFANAGGGSSLLGIGAAVPEAGTLVLALFAFCGASLVRTRRG